MSETMIHKVAMAIAEADLSDGPDDTTYDFFALPEEIVDGYYRIARAAVEAMREPTLEMLKASDNLILNDEEFHAGPYELTKAEWRAMIDAALKEQTK